MSPLAIPELLDQILRHLIDYPKSKGLLACALVRRSWKHPAQSNLYWHVLLAIYPGEPDLHKLDRPCTLLLHTLRSSPHLARLIRSLELYPEGLSSGNLTALLNTPIPMLHTLYLAYRWPTELSVTGMKQLLARPTLKHVQIRCSSGDSEDIFQSLFGSLAQSVTEMEFFPGRMFPLVKDTPIVVYRGAPLRIDSFRLKGGFSAGIFWLESVTTRRYLDFSHLRRLSLGVDYHYLQTPLFVAAARTIEVLKLDTRHDTGFVDISPYIHIKSLYISCEEDDDIWTAASIIESIRPECTSRIQKLGITGPLSDAGMAAIREHVADTLPVLLDVLEVQYVEPPQPVGERSPIPPEYFRRNPSSRYRLGNYF
ncbi:hypothetical protein FB45DRAFT_1098319 [Roridomyces roridus]|uniref:F-box domain-containing protein n=1 Tax=Roridomyces roridus TaxID=1738132 RepID=A0AAD7FZN8_9AGAR|nr:hypothetical protein FB45DRAFT_1098319 [Roridomyces roridus]